MANAPRPAIAARLAVALGAALAAGSVHAQAAVTVSVAAHVLASCTTTIAHPQPTCSQQTMAQQSDVAGASARIATSVNDVGVTQQGGPSPKIELNGNQATVTF
ncbi:MAG TPA: hypothetical protein VEG36_00845 [Burkholderiales bacterium]|nr:hypothetical protein [Burkholderiales bacterium]